MQFKLSPKKKKWIAVGALVLCTATPSFALFGLGDIVFDPTSYASLVSQLSTLTKMYTTATSQYTSIKNNLVNFSIKTQWQTALNSMKNVQVRNTYGETNGLTAALDQNSTTAATTAWTNSSVALSSNTRTYLASESAGNSDKLTQLAIVETSDTVSPDCLNAVGSYRAARAASVSANASLQANQLDGTGATNSEVQQMNLINASQAQQLNEQQAQGALHACIAQQMTVQNMQQREAMVHDLNLAGDVQAQRSANQTAYVNSTGTYTDYLP
jgi:type IV secretion system protein TrbJ